MKTEHVLLIIVLSFLILVVLLYVAWLIKATQKFINMKKKIDNSEESIDKLLQSRYDVFFQLLSLLPESIRNTFDDVSNPGVNLTMEEKQVFAEVMNSHKEELENLLLNHKDMIDEVACQELQQKQHDIEENLQASKRVYNQNVAFYNHKVKYFPYKNFAKRRGYHQRPYFEPEPFIKKID